MSSQDEPGPEETTESPSVHEVHEPVPRIPEPRQVGSDNEDSLSHSPRFTKTLGSAPRKFALASPRPVSARSQTLTPRTIGEPSFATKAYMEKALQHDSLNGATEELLDDVILHLGNERRKKARDHSFRDGAKYNAAVSYATDYLLTLKKKALQKEESSQRKNVLDEFKQQLQTFDNETKKLIEDLTAQQTKQREELANSQEKSFHDLEHRWNGPAKRRLYNRATNRLINLKRQQALMLMDNRFDDAANVQVQIKEQTKLEEADNEKQMKFDFTQAEKQLRTRQQEEKQTFETNASITMEQLKMKRARLRVAYERREAKLVNRLTAAGDKDKVWNARSMERSAEMSAGMNRSLFYGPPKTTRDDVGEREFTFLALPPLKAHRSSRRAKRSLSVK